ncbi:hypothetical protein [Xanthomonas sp. 3058]|uniref:hypothetical protein n=1 Tax=Xanthomonas sp. 3058 TaxID=3035314 RepID=UPI00162111C5|nr:hypothetical protein [Xanthomonas sp. 3058]MBB5862576.1 hypothetical protein [Xanthomonas sp. 3058]
MTVGTRIQVQDGSGALQIDENYRNYFMRAKYNVQLTQKNLFTSAQSCGEFAIGLQCQNTPVVAIGGPGAVGAVLTIFPPNTGHGTPGQYTINLVGPLNASITVYLFDNIAPSEISDYGLIFWDLQGRVKFDALGKMLKVVGRISAIRDQTSDAIAIPAGRAYAIICTGAYYSQGVSGSNFVYFGRGAAITTTGFATIGTFQTGTSTTQITPTQTPRCTGFVIDVTGY